jgi:adenosylcobyric acid synthase
MTRAIFIGGTSSNSGKSWMTTALCRLLYRRGIRVAPFKAQNMSNNSYPCADGAGEIGRSQVTQALACGLTPEPAMNPVLLKPCGESKSQVILHGKVWRTLDARDYYGHAPFLREQALNAFQDLARRFEVIVMEGAGSIAELNLRGRDFTNLSMAQAVGAKGLLVADIERGGVFASILGTLDLLTPAERSLIRCFAVNRFRGDPSLFADGVTILEQRSGIPCLGVFPHANDIHLDAEDSLAEPFSPRSNSSASNDNVAIIRFPRISNSTDFRLFNGAAWVERPLNRQFEFVVLPGTKSTLADLAWLRETGLASWIQNQHKAGATVIGICGGYQMLGEFILDPQGVDGAPGECAGLGLIAATTVMELRKTTRVRRARTQAGAVFDAYEIHMGATRLEEREAPPFAILEDGSHDGVHHRRVIGTYLHGALESPRVFKEIFGIEPGPTSSRDASFDALADWLERNSAASTLADLYS